MTTNDLQDIGPIDYLVVEFPGSRMTGEGLPLLVDLVDRGIIRILDFVFVKKELDGSVRGWPSPTSTRTASSTSPSSRAPPPGSWPRRTWSRLAACSSRAARPGSWSTRTAGRPPSPVPCGVAAARSSPVAASRSRTCSPRSTPPSPSSSSQPPPEKGSAMPGLLRGVARTAVIAGTATAVSNRVSRRQANRWAAQEQQAYGQQGYGQQG